MTRCKTAVVTLAGLLFAVGASTASGQMSVRVDPRIELFTVVQLLAGRMPSPVQSAYATEVKKYFEPFSQHRAVTLARQASAKMDWGFPSYAMYLGELPTLTIPTDAPYWNANADSVWNREYVDAVRDFATASRFENFIATHASAYETWSEDVRATVGQSTMSAALREFAGPMLNSETILLSPLLSAGATAPVRERPDGLLDAFAVVGAVGIDGANPSFGSRDRFVQLLWHEFAHALVNPGISQVSGEINQSAILHVPIARRLRRADGIQNWQTDVNEHLVRGIVIHLLETAFGPQAAEVERRKQQGFGFLYLPDVLVWLKEYEQNRDVYPTLGAFLPELARRFQLLAKQPRDAAFYEPVFSGPMGAARYDDENMAFVLIVPTHEMDAVAERKITEEVQGLRDRFFKDSFVITDEQALETDLANYSLRVYGTIEGNAFLKAHASEFPDMLRELVTEPNSRVAAVVQNPSNPRRSMLVFTGSIASGVSGLDFDVSLGNRNSDFVLFSGEAEKRVGDFPLGTWRRK